MKTGNEVPEYGNKDRDSSSLIASIGGMEYGDSEEYKEERG